MQAAVADPSDHIRRQTESASCSCRGGECFLISESPIAIRLNISLGINAAGRRSKRQDAQREMTRLLASADAGTLPEHSKATIAEYLRDWLDNDRDLAPKTKGRYRELAEGQIIPRQDGVAAAQADAHR
jgi:hypothetical protein